MIIKKRFSLLLLLISLSFLLLASSPCMAEEVRPYAETLLEMQEDSMLIAMSGEPGGSILALVEAMEGGYRLLRWKDQNGIPEEIPISVTDLKFTSIDVAPDGGVALIATQEEQPLDANGLLKMKTAVVWVDDFGAEAVRIIIDENGTPLMLQKALSGRRFACASWFDELIIYDDAGTAFKRENIKGIQSLAADDEAVYCFTPDTVYRWTPDDYEKMPDVAVAAMQFNKMSMDADGAIYALGENEINRIDLEKGQTQLFMEGTGTYLGDVHFFVRTFVALPGGRFALHVENMGAFPPEAKLPENSFIATYQAMENIQSRTPFVVTSIYENLLAKQTVSEFQRLHPELKVELRTFVNQRTGDIPLDDVIRSMNTELLAGKGGDVLVLDRLPIDAIIARGMLKDISHIAEEFQLLPGISESIRHTDGKVYAIPAEFGVYLLFGDKQTIDPIKTLSDVRDATLAQGQMRLPMSTKLLDFFATSKQDFTNDKGEVLFQSERFIEFLDIVYSFFDEIDSEATGISPENRAAMDQTSLKNGMIAFYPVVGTNISRIQNYYEKLGRDASAFVPMPSLSGSSRAYQPKVIVGIPTNAPDPSASEAFIRLMLSDEMYLQTHFQSGFSTVEKKLDALFELRTKYINDENWNKIYYQDDSGVRITTFPSEDFYLGLRQIFNDVSFPYYYDSAILTFIEEEIAARLGGDFNAQEAAESIEQRAFQYLNE